MRESNLSPDKKIELFWQRTFKSATDDKLNLKDIILPLARIKRLMKVEEGVRMVASEVPILFSLVAEKFVEELTLRAWINTEENKRRILQLNDISVAVKTSEMFDFLVYVVPRSEMNSVFDRMIGSSEKLYQHLPIVLGKSPLSDKMYKSSMSDTFSMSDKLYTSLDDIKGNAHNINMNGNAQNINMNGNALNIDMNGNAHNINMNGNAQNINMNGNTIIGNAQNINMNGNDLSGFNEEEDHYEDM